MLERIVISLEIELLERQKEIECRALKYVGMKHGCFMKEVSTLQHELQYISLFWKLFFIMFLKGRHLTDSPMRAK